jgi:hypothetical protein
MLRRIIRLHLLPLLAVALCTPTTPAFSASITLNENFPNPFNLAASPVTAGTLLLCDQGDMVLDPSKTGKAGVWGCGIFQTGFGAKLHEPSDSIVFSNPAMGKSQVVFCSNIDSANIKGDTGDTCAPAMTGNLAILEQGTENVFESTPYNPANGQPGFGMIGTAAVSYVLISDANVPEPSSLLLFGVALFTLVFRLRGRIA